jgi:CBS domain-containing protein
MTAACALEPITPLNLGAAKAADLMTTDPISVREDATVREAVTLLTDKGFSAAPVIDEAGRPVGVLSSSDLMAHLRERLPGVSEEAGMRTRVRDLMTPVVFSVRPDTPAARVVQEMVALKVHRLFVVDADGILTGVISSLDVLRQLRA